MIASICSTVNGSTRLRGTGGSVIRSVGSWPIALSRTAARNTARTVLNTVRVVDAAIGSPVTNAWMADGRTAAIGWLPNAG